MTTNKETIKKLKLYTLLYAVAVIKTEIMTKNGKPTKPNNKLKP